MATGLFGWNPIDTARKVLGPADLIPGFDPVQKVASGVLGAGTSSPSPQQQRPMGEPYGVPTRSPLSDVGSGGGTGGGGSYGGGSSAPSYNPEDLAYLDAQAGELQRQLGRTDSTLATALAKIVNEHNKELSGANLQRSRNLEDFDTKTQISEQGRGRELGKVDTSARMLADSLRQRLGLASGSGSSAYQITAPRAVQRDASTKREDVLTDYSANFKQLDTDKRRGEEDFARLLAELNTIRSEREGGARGDIAAQKGQINSNLARIAGEKSRLLGGGYAGVRAAMAPYEAQIRAGESEIDNIFNKYATKYNVEPIKVVNTQLRDYAVDKTALRDQAAGNQSEYAPFRPPFGDDEEEQLV